MCALSIMPTALKPLVSSIDFVIRLKTIVIAPMLISGSTNAVNRYERRLKLYRYSRRAISQIFLRFIRAFFMVPGAVTRHADKDVVQARYRQRKTAYLVVRADGQRLHDVVRFRAVVQH